MRCRALLLRPVLRTTRWNGFNRYQGTTSAGKFRIAVRKPLGCAKCHQSRMIVGTHKRCPFDARLV